MTIRSSRITALGTVLIFLSGCSGRSNTEPIESALSGNPSRTYVVVWVGAVDHRTALAEVVVTCGTCCTVTNAKGEAVIGPVAGNNLTVTVEKPGYLPETRTLPIDEHPGTRKATFLLTRAVLVDAATPSRAHYEPFPSRS